MTKLLSISTLLFIFGVTAVFEGTTALEHSGEGSSESFMMKQGEVNANDNDDRPLAIVRRYRPEVNIFKAGSPGMMAAERAQQLFDSDTLVTAEDGYAVVQFMDNSVARVQPNSVLIVSGEITDQQTTAARLALELGEVFLDVNDDDGSYEVSTSSAVAAVRGTEFISKSHEDGRSTFTGFTGEVEITALNSGEMVTMLNNTGIDVDADGNEISQFELTENELAELRDEYEQMDQRTESETIRLEFENEDGEIREIELRYYDNN